MGTCQCQAISSKLSLETFLLLKVTISCLLLLSHSLPATNSWLIFIQICHFKREASIQHLLTTKSAVLLKNSCTSSYSPWAQWRRCFPSTAWLTACACRPSPTAQVKTWLLISHPFSPPSLLSPLFTHHDHTQKFTHVPSSENLPWALIHWWGKYKLAPLLWRSGWQYPLIFAMCTACGTAILPPRGLP